MKSVWSCRRVSVALHTATAMPNANRPIRCGFRAIRPPGAARTAADYLALLGKIQRLLTAAIHPCSLWHPRGWVASGMASALSIGHESLFKTVHWCPRAGLEHLPEIEADRHAGLCSPWRLCCWCASPADSRRSVWVSPALRGPLPVRSSSLGAWLVWAAAITTIRNQGVSRARNQE